MKLSSEYRKVARENLKNNWGNAIVVCLITLGISTLLGFIPVVGSIASFLLGGPLVVAEIIYFVKLHKKENPTIGTMFTDFGTNLIDNFAAYVLQMIFIALWSFLFFIPGLIKSYSYAMTMYLKSKNPKFGANEAITLSRKMMDGKKWKLFCLHLSFIGWMFVCVFTLGIGFIFLLPYMQASTIAFYEDAYTEYEQINNPTEIIEEQATEEQPAEEDNK